MKILLIGRGEPNTVGTFFDNALKETGIDHESIDLRKYFRMQGYSIFNKLMFRIVGSTINAYLYLNREILRKAEQFHPDVVLVIKGANIKPMTLKLLKQNYKSILVNFATDDPFSPYIRSKNIINCIPLYDMYACTKRAIMDDVKKAGGKKVVFVPFAYDPKMHHPEKPKSLVESKRFASDLVFIGGGDAYRRKIMQSFSTIQNLNLHLYGGYWNKYPELNRYYRGYAFRREFRLAYSLSKVAPGLVRHSNRDGHSMRSFEIPACGAFMLAEDTEEHREIFRENQEAVFFKSTDELIDKSKYYLKHNSERQRIAEAGYYKIVNEKNTYQDRLLTILENLTKL